MQLDLTEVQLRVQAQARRFAKERLAPRAAVRDAQELFPDEELRALGEAGLLGVSVPRTLGGAEAGAVAYALAMMELSAACAATSVSFGVTNMCAELINTFGTATQRARFVPPLTSGRATAGAFALSEAHCGSDAGALRTRAERRGDRWVINGTKQWITSGAAAGVICVWARTSPDGNRGLSCFVMDRQARGVVAGRPEDKCGVRGSQTVALTFEDCEVDDEQRLGALGDGFKLAMSALDGGRIGIASQAVGVGLAAVAAMVSEAHARRARGEAPEGLQRLDFAIADARTRLEAARLLALRAASRKERSLPYTLEASMAKLFASETANRACEEALGAIGLAGCAEGSAVERSFRDARVQTVYEGTSEIQRLVIARTLLAAWAED